MKWANSVNQLTKSKHKKAISKKQFVKAISQKQLQKINKQKTIVIAHRLSISSGPITKLSGILHVRSAAWRHSSDADGRHVGAQRRQCSFAENVIVTHGDNCRMFWTPFRLWVKEDKMWHYRKFIFWERPAAETSIIERNKQITYFLGQNTTNDNLFHTFRQFTIYNLCTYNHLKHNSYEVIEMASRYTALAIKIDNFIGNMSCPGLNISKSRYQPYWFIFTNLKGIPWCIPTPSFKKFNADLFFSIR